MCVEVFWETKDGTGFFKNSDLLTRKDRRQIRSHERRNTRKLKVILRLLGHSKYVYFSDSEREEIWKLYIQFVSQCNRLTWNRPGVQVEKLS
jgi:hypothetical protein